MNKTFILPVVIAAAFSACVTSPKPAPKPKCSGIASPDHKLCVRLVEVGKHAAPLNEHRVEIRNAAEQLVRSKSFKSSDGEHGRSVAKSGWTPNSRFFVFTTQSSGGHSPWHWTTYFYDRQRNTFRLLDDFTGPVIKENIVITAPDRVRVIVQGTPADPSDIGTGTPKTVQLSTVP